jgi:hypothetical protein
MDHRSVDSRFIHRRQRLFLRKRLLPMVGGWRALGPQMNLGIDNHHGISPPNTTTLSDGGPFGKSAGVL